MKILDLTIKKDLFHLIEYGDKCEDYRNTKPSWIKKLTKLRHKSLLFSYRNGYTPIPYKEYTHVRFRLSYTKQILLFRIESITFGKGKKEWGAPEDKDVFIIKFKKPTKESMSATNCLHHQLCCEGAKYILTPKAKEPWEGRNKWSCVEIVTMGCELPDVYANNGENSTVIEVKTSHQDFMNDKHKYCRSVKAKNNNHILGNYHYYLCPENVIKEDELPENWGLLYWDGKKITKVKKSKFIESNKQFDMYILSSILRREIGTNKIFNYRKNNI